MKQSWVRLQIQPLNRIRLLSFAFEHILPKGRLYALLILVKLFMLGVWGPAAVRGNDFK